MFRQSRNSVGHFLTMAILPVALAACSPAPDSAESEALEPVSSEAPKGLPLKPSPFSTEGDIFVANRILVKAQDNTDAAQVESEIAKHGGKLVGKVRALDVHIVELPENVNEKAVAALLAHNPKFEFAEVDRIETESFVPNDSYYSSQWHLRNIGTPTAWDTARGAGVIIAILDSGVDSDHPDLAAQLVPGWNIYDNNSNWEDQRTHGTRVAGSAAAIANNSMGVAGIAPSAKIMPIRVSSLEGATSSSLVASGLTWAADHGARVANISFQTPCLSSTAQSAANYFRSKGGVVTGAAGNYGVDEGFASSSAVTCVSATTSSNVLASWSSFGSFVDVAAPGSGIYTTTPGGGYVSVSGTSFAAPITAGVYALMLSANPNLTPAQLDQILFSTVLDLGTAGKDSTYGHGRIDASRAVAQAKALATPADTQAPAASISAPTASAVVAESVSINVTASDNTAVTKVELYANGALIGTDTTAPYTFTYNTLNGVDGPLSFQAKASDAAGNVGTSAAVAVTVQNKDIQAPVVQILKPLNGSSIASARWTVSISATATDNRAVASMKLYIDGTLRASSTSGTLNYGWYVRRVRSGGHTIKVTAQDAAGNVGSRSIQVYK